MKYALKYALIICIIVTILPGCEEEKPTEPYKEVTTPEITSVEPDTLYGGEPISINGEHFNPDPNKNLVRFGYTSLFGYKSVLADSVVDSTTIFATTPVGGGMEDTPVPVQVLNTEGPPTQWSDGEDVTFKAILSIFSDDFGAPYGVAVDDEGNVYVSDGDDWVVYKFSADGGNREVYTGQGGNGDITFDGDGNLYICVGGDWGSEIWIVPPGGGDAELFSDNADLSPFDIDFDEDHNMYVGGRWAGLHRISAAGEVTVLDVPEVDLEDPLGVRVFDGYLYWSNQDYNSIERAPITADGLGPAEVFFIDNSGSYMDSPLGIEIDSKGNIYVVSKEWGGNKNLSMISPDGSPEVIIELPSGNNRHLAIGNESIYVVSRGANSVYKVYIGADPAPTY